MRLRYQKRPPSIHVGVTSAPYTWVRALRPSSASARAYREVWGDGAWATTAPPVTTGIRHRARASIRMTVTSRP
jgi:hypothetical protein